MDHLDTAELLIADDKIKALICGLPHSLTSHVVDLCRQMLAQEHGQCNLINLNNLAEDARQQIIQADGPILLWADSPDRDVVQFAAKASFPLAILQPDFAAAAHDFMAERSAKVVDSLRVLALSKMGLWQMSKLPRVLSIDQDTEKLGLTIEKLAKHTPHFKVTPNILSHADAAYSAMRNEAKVRTSTFDLKNDILTGKAIADFGEFYGKFNPEEALEFNIPISVLYDGKPPYDTFSGPIQLCGPVRALTFGPFAYLPVGQWALTFTFEARNNITGNSFMFDVFADMMVKNRTDFELRQDGQFTYRCDFEIIDSWQTFEFRTNLHKGSIDGIFCPISLKLEKIH